MHILLFILFCLSLVPHGIDAVNGLYCYQCFDQANPADCHQISICGEDEICYTREYKDNNGNRGYHLGCEDISICTLFKDAQLLLGKRSVDAGDAPLRKCFDCCSSNQCNSGLCRNSTTSQTTTAMPMGPSTSSSGIYKSFRNSDYLISDIELSWKDAQKYCHNEGGDLASITSPEEQNFMANQLIAHNATTQAYFWLGGYHSANEWKWSDGSPFNYTSEFPLFSNQAHSDSLVISNPAYGMSLNFATWSYDNPAHARVFICEMDRIFGK